MSLSRSWITLMEFFPLFSLYHIIYEFSPPIAIENYTDFSGIQWRDLSDHQNGMSDVLTKMVLEWFMFLLLAFCLDKFGSFCSGIRKVAIVFRSRLDGKSFQAAQQETIQLQEFNTLVEMERTDIIRESNASSGMGVAPNIRDTFLDLQMKKAFRYVIFKIEEKQKEVVVEKTGATTESYDDFLASLPENDCRYAIYDFDFVTGENVQKSKIFFIAWSPSTSRIRAKMLYATSKDRIKHELDGFHYEIQATDPSEVDLEVLRERAH